MMEARGRPKMSLEDQLQKLQMQNGRCDSCDAEILGNNYSLTYLKSRNQGGRNDFSNISLVCPDCSSPTRTMSVRLSKKLHRRMERVIELERISREETDGVSPSKSDLLKDWIETMVQAYEFKQLSDSDTREFRAISKDHTHVIRITPVKKIGGRHEGKLRIVISGPLVDKAGLRSKTLYSESILDKAKQKAATWVNCEIKDFYEDHNDSSKYDRLEGFKSDFLWGPLDISSTKSPSRKYINYEPHIEKTENFISKLKMMIDALETSISMLDE